MQTWIIWIIVALALGALEVAMQTVWMLCLAAGCLGGLAATLCGAGPGTQIVVMAAASVAAYIAFLPLFRRWKQKHARKISRDDRTGMEALLGRRAIVTEAIRPGLMGRVRIDGDSWQARTQRSDVMVLPGAEVTVTAYDSIILTVSI